MRRQLIWAVALVLAGFGLASAQETTSGSITGDVIDAQGAPVPGAAVSVISAQGTKTFTTDANGRFFAPYLTPGKYSVRVELSGFSPIEQKDIDVRLGQRLTLSGLTLKVGGLQEVVEVVGAAPVVDITSTTSGGTLDSEMLKRLPVGRKFTDTLYLVPGVSDSSGAGMANPSIGGGSGLENNYVVDGVNITDVGFGGVGTYNSVYGSLGTGVTTDFIKETQVKTGGFEAEYGQSTGGVVNVITQSGTNDFHGAVYGYFRPQQFEGDYRNLQAPNGVVNTVGQTVTDFGASLGGPLMKDRLFFFGAVNPQFETLTRIAPEGPEFTTMRALGEVDRKRRTISYAGKLTYQANANHRFDLTVFGDPTRGEEGPQRATALRRITDQANGGFSELEFGGHNQTLRYDGIINANWLVEASIARAKNEFDEVPTIDQFSYTDLRTVPQRVSGGLGGFELSEGRNLQYSLKSTNIFNLGGSHQLRYGVGFEDIEFARIFEYSGPDFTLADGTRTVTGATVEIRDDGAGNPLYRATRARYSPAGLTNQKYLSLFLQDTWTIGKRLTLRPGVRWDRQRLVGQDPGSPTDAVPDLCREDDSRPGAGDGAGAVIPCEFVWDQNFAPRIGAIFDVLGNGRAKAYASWGRFYGKIPNDLAARAMSADAGITRGDYRDAALTQAIPNGVDVGGTTSHLRLAGTHAAIIDPEARSTYKTEFVGGLEFDVGRSVNLGVRYVHRSIPRILEDIGQLAMAGYLFDESADVPVDYFITNVTNATATVNCCGLPPAAFEDPVHKYDAIEVTATKNFADNWGMVASYRFARLKGGFEGFFRSDNGQSDPAITSLFDFPTNDPSYTQVGVPQFGFAGDIRFLGTTLGEGRLPNDRPHQFKLYGNYAIRDLNLGAGFNYGSGRVLTPLAANPIYVSDGEIPEALRGSGIETATDGFRERAPHDVQFDLHADYTLKFGDRRVVLLADVFNLFNRQEPTDFDNFTESSPGIANPNFGLPTAGGGISTPGFQLPRQLRLGARFEW
jgi:hypothetical protein